MLPITTIISRIRENINDSTKTGYMEKEIVATINSAIRFLRRTIKVYKPMMLAEILEGSLNDPDLNNPANISGVFEGSVIFKEKLPTSFLDVRVDGVRIEPINIAFINDFNTQGTPTRYYQFGINTIKFYPMPNKKIDYKITFISDFTELTKDDTTPFPNDFDDFIIEYSVIRLAMGDEFNVSQEAELMTNIHEQIKQNLLCSANEAACVTGYFNSVVEGW